MNRTYIKLDVCPGLGLHWNGSKQIKTMCEMWQSMNQIGLLGFSSAICWRLPVPGKLTKKLWKITMFMGKSTISMAIFNSFLFVYQRVFGLKPSSYLHVLLTKMLSLMTFLTTMISSEVFGRRDSVMWRPRISRGGAKKLGGSLKLTWGWVKTLYPGEHQNSW